MDELSLGIPNPNVMLRALDLPPLSDYAEEQLRRACAFFTALKESELTPRFLLAGYTRDIHQRGAALTSCVSGDRTFAEWRLWRSLRPIRDPDLPEQLAELDAFTDEWQPKALAIAANWPDADERQELEGLLRMPDLPSRAWRAKSWIERLKLTRMMPTLFHRNTWEALVRAGIERDLEHSEGVLRTLQEYIRKCPLDAEELAEIQEMRESMARELADWLRQRRAQLARHLSERSLPRFALDNTVPPPPPEIPLDVIAQFPAGALA